MHRVTKNYLVYPFDELDEQGKSFAIGAHIEFEIELLNGNCFEHDEEAGPGWMVESIKEMEKMQTPWFLGEYIYEHYKEEIIATIKANNYLFFSDGRLIPTDLYPDERPITKRSIYDEICKALTDFEEGRLIIEDIANQWYTLLVKIQNNWECVITAQDD